MSSQEIAELREEVLVRKLTAQVLDKIRRIRPGTGYDTVRRALLTENFENATPLLQRILQEAKKVLADDDIRIAQHELSQTM